MHAVKGSKDHLTNTSKNPSDLQITEDRQGRTVDVDVTIVSGLASSKRKAAASRLNATTNNAEDMKHKKYKDYYEKNKNILGDRYLMVFALDILEDTERTTTKIVEMIVHESVVKSNVTFKDAYRKIVHSISAKLISFIGAQIRHFAR